MPFFIRIFSVASSHSLDTTLLAAENTLNVSGKVNAKATPLNVKKSKMYAITWKLL